MLGVGMNSKEENEHHAFKKDGQKVVQVEPIVV